MPETVRFQLQKQSLPPEPLFLSPGMRERQNTAFIFEIQHWNEAASHHEKANEFCEKVRS